MEAEALTLLSPPPSGVVCPPGMAPVSEPVASEFSASAVLVGDSPEPLVTLPAALPSRVFYDDLPLSPRGPLRLRAGVVDRLLSAADALPAPFGLTVLDGWRSNDFQSELLDYYRALFPQLGDGYVSDPDHAAIVPPHTTGAAVDLTLNWNGTPLGLGTDYDSFSDLAHPAALETPGSDVLSRDLRRLLSAVLLDAGFAPHPLEWWHWSYGDQWWAAHEGLPVSLYGATG